MYREHHANFIIISGSGKKVGKTYLAVDLLRHFSCQTPVLALKISPHRHDKLGKVDSITETEGFRLFRELEVHDKNSGQFLKAGAQASFFLETGDGFLGRAIKEFLIKCNPTELPVICESGALGKIFKPGLLIYIDDPGSRSDHYKESIKQIADLILPARKFSAADVIKSIRMENNCWTGPGLNGKKTNLRS
jgi:hypothetical protein